MKLFRYISNKLSRRKTENASVVDYKNAKTLEAALVGDEGSTSYSSTSESLDSIMSARPVQWKPIKYDKRRSEPQTVKQEMARLEVLKSYMILDSEREEMFNRLTSVCSAVFGAAMCYVSLVDLGRLWLLSASFPQVADEYRRDIGICSHAIISKDKVFLVPDMLKDPRFRENPMVTGGPKIRFFAGAALVSPEGYKLGMLCVVGDKPRKGITDGEKDILTNLAGAVMDAIVARRNRILKEEGEKRIREIGMTMADTHRIL